MDSVQCGDHLGGFKQIVNSGGNKEAAEDVGKFILSLADSLSQQLLLA